MLSHIPIVLRYPPLYPSVVGFESEICPVGPCLECVFPIWYFYFERLQSLYKVGLTWWKQISRGGDLKVIAWSLALDTLCLPPVLS